MPLQLANEKVYFKPCRAKPALRLTALKDSPLSERLFSARCEEFKIFKTPKIEFIWLKVDMADSDSEN